MLDFEVYNARSIVKTLPKYGLNMPKTCPKHAWNMTKTCPKHNQHMAKTWLVVAKSTYSWPKHCLLLRNRHILGQNISYCCEIGMFLARTLVIVAKSIYSWPKHCLLLRNRYILRLAYCCEMV